MATVKIGERHQVTIPAEFFRNLKLKAGDLLEAVMRDNAIVFIPAQVIPRDQAWFWTKEWQEKEREADENIAKGEYKEYDNPEDLITELRKLRKKG